jgi:twitching motility protein PilI
VGDVAEAFAMLVAVARGATESALPLPAQEQPAEQWRGLAFNVGSTRLLSEIGEVQEVIELPELTRVPGTAPWLLGIANVRGRLVPVVDLCGYLGFEKSTREEEWRVLVVEDGELLCGLLVEQAFGMMQFERDDADADEDVAAGNALDPWLRSAFRQSGRHWRVLDIRTLVNEPVFFEVAA